MSTAAAAAVEPIKRLAQFVAGISFEVVHDLAYGQSGWEPGKPVYVIGLNLQSDYLTLERLGLLANQFVQALGNRTGQEWAAILGTPHQVVGDIVYCVPRSFGLHKLILAQMFVYIKSNLEKGERHSPPR